jgi:hypothetical protein
MTVASGGRITVMLLADSLGAGSERRRLIELARGLDRGRFRVLAVGLRGDDFLEGEVDGEGVEYIPSIGARGAWDVTSVLVLASVLRREAVDVLQVMSSSAEGFGLLAAKLAGTPIRVATRSTESKTGARGWFERRLLRSATAVVADGERIARRLVATGIQHSRVEVIPEGISEEDVSTNLQERNEVRSRYGISDDSWLIGISAETLAEPMLGHTLQAASIVRAEVPGTKFMFLGGAAEESALVRRSMILGLHGSVIVAACQPQTAGYVGAMDLVVVPEERGVGVQAMGLGRPVVATDAGSNAELFPMGEVGLVVPPENALILAHAILELMRHPDAVERMRKGGRRLFQERFTSRKMIGAYEELYAELWRSHVGRKMPRGATVDSEST